MATRVRLTADVDPELKKRVRIAAIESDTSVSEWVERAMLRELERESRVSLETHETDIYLPEPAAKLRIPENPIRLRGGPSMAETVLEDRGER